MVELGVSAALKHHPHGDADKTDPTANKIGGRDMQDFGITLKPLAEEDFPLFQELYSHSDVMRHIAVPLTGKSAEALFSYVLGESQKAVPDCRYWSIVTHINEPVGLIGLVFNRPELDDAEIGIILKPFLRMPRVSDIAMKQLIQTAIQSNMAKRITAHISTSNHPAISLVERLGFAPHTDIANNWQWWSAASVDEAL